MDDCAVHDCPKGEQATEERFVEELVSCHDLS